MAPSKAWMDLVDDRISDECLDGNTSKKIFIWLVLKSSWTMPSVGLVGMLKLNIHVSDAAIHTLGLVK